MAKIETILVVGGGVAGLTTASALHRHGFTTELVERQQGWHALGAGFLVQANGMRMLPSVPMIMRHLSPKSLASGRRTEITWLCRTEMRSRMVPLGLTRWEAGGRPPWQPQRRQLPNSRTGRADGRSLGRTS